MRIIFIAIVIVALNACGKENKNYKSSFTLVNAVPNSNGFTLEAGNVVVDNNIMFGSPRFGVTAPAATTTFHLKHNSGTLIDTSFLTDIPNGSKFLLFFYDSLGKLKTFLARETWQQTASSSQAYLRLMPMVINAATLQVANDTNRILIPSQTFGDFGTATTDFAAVDTTVSKLKFFQGTSAIDSITGVKLLAGHSYTIYATGVLGASGDKKPVFLLHAE
jgi:hypothetical protein